MRIRLDENELTLDSDIIEQGKAAILDEAKRAALADRRVVIGISVDGEEIDEEIFTSLAGGIDIRFVTQSVRDLLEESMRDGAAYLGNLERGLANIATAFETGKESEGQAQLAQAIEGINWLLGVLDRSCLLLGVDPDNLKSGNFEADFSVFRDVLDEMASIMEEGKTMKLAFLIRDKLIDAIQNLGKYWAEIEAMVEAPLQ